MRDWQALVRDRFKGRGLSEVQQSEVVAELAAHLEDLYDEERALGVSESDAVRRALGEVEDWRQLTRRIQCSKQQEGQMNHRTRSLWLPGLVSLAGAMATLSIMNRLGVEPRIIWYGSKVGLELYLPWLMVLPLFGGLGAYLSQRAHGQMRVRLTAALFPVVLFFGLFCLSITISGLVERHLTWGALPIAFSLTFLNWVLIPGAALFLGTLPFLGYSETREPKKATC